MRRTPAIDTYCARSPFNAVVVPAMTNSVSRFYETFEIRNEHIITQVIVSNLGKSIYGKRQNGRATNRRRKKVLKAAKGYFGNKSRLYRYAVGVERSGQYAYRDRKKKSTMRQLWIARINAACRANGINYSRFLAGLNTAEIKLDRKQLSELAIHDEESFKVLVEKAKEANATAKAA